jgi:hypothetical protein
MDIVVSLFSLWWGIIWWVFFVLSHFFSFSDLMQWCVWGLLLELTFLPYLLYAFILGMVHMIFYLMIPSSVLTWDLLVFLFCFGHRWNIDNVFLAWYLFPLYAMHPLGQNGCITRFLILVTVLFVICCRSSYPILILILTCVLKLLAGLV